jgi:Na+-driven multidrug efflux pump
MLFGMINFGVLILNILILDPLFLFGLKTGIIGAGLGTLLSEVVPAVSLTILYYLHKFGIKPLLGQFCQKFSSRTWTALRVGASQLVSNLSAFIPAIVIRKLIGNATGDQFDDAMAGFNSAVRYNFVSIAFFNAVSMGFIPAASYAFAAKQYKRYLWLSFHAIWLCVVCGCITTSITWSLSREISKLFSTSEGYLEQAEKMVKWVNGAAPVTGFKFNAQAMLQSMQLGGKAMLLSFVNNFVLLLGFSLLLYYTDQNDGTRIVWCYPASHVVAILISLGFLWYPVRDVWRLHKETSEPLHEIALQSDDNNDNDEDEHLTEELEGQP